MKKEKRRGGLRTSFLFMTIVPILATGIIILVVSFNRVQSTVYSEVEQGMKSLTYTLVNTYETMYPGEFNLAQSGNVVALAKGKTVLDSDYLSSIHEDTGLEISILYGDMRMLTTLTDADGAYLAGTYMNASIKKLVMTDDTEAFFANTNINGEAYFAYYKPLHSADGEVIGAVEVLRAASDVKHQILNSVLPIIIIAGIAMILAGALSLAYSVQIRRAFDKILKFLQAVRKGDLDTKMNSVVAARNDEIGEMAQAATSMQYSLRELVERDALTKLYNRRYGNLYLKKAWKYTEQSGTHYCVAIGDIDFFKKVNDTYGHDAGDVVLQTTASILKNHMTGKGMVARWGGEEFLFVFEDKDLDTAEEILWGILGEIRETVVAYDDLEIRYTMSYGVTDAEGKTIEAALRDADENLYYAKEHGRNQVIKALLQA